MVKCTDCGNNAYYNVKNEKAKYCKTHKTNDMVNVLEKRKCQFPDCESQPSFNVKGQTIGIFCGTHKKGDMIDVKNKKCQFPDCTSQPCFNVKGKTTGIYCGTHKKGDMIDVKNKKCQHPDCDHDHVSILKVKLQEYFV